MTGTKIEPARLDTLKCAVDAALERALCGPLLRDAPPGLGEAIRYAALAQGKRIRPLLLLAAHECCGGKPYDVLQLSCAVEIIHAASLVHDDLPSMDDHSLRRSRPSLHRVDGEAIAILSGVAMVAHAFQMIAETAANGHVAGVVQSLSKALGTAGMCGGQLIDLSLDRDEAGNGISLAELESLYHRKTGALMAAATEIGALTAGADANLTSVCRAFGERFGLAFQIVDDLHDLEADLAIRKPTFATVSGPRQARARAKILLAENEAAVSDFGLRARLLSDLGLILESRLEAAKA